MNLFFLIIFKIDSIKNECKYQGYKVGAVSDFSVGKWTCPTKGCNRMGHLASPNKDVGMHYVKIQSGTDMAKNKCNVYFYSLQANPSNSGQAQTQGTFKFTITGTKGVLDNLVVYDVYNLNFLLNNKILNFFGEAPQNIGSILNV